MNKYHFAHVPNQDMFSGLVHGSFHALRAHEQNNPNKHQLAVVYVDITAHAATSALYAILKRPHIQGMLPTAYIDNHSVRGFTAAREFSVFLSPSLNYVDQKQLGEDLLRFFDAVEKASQSGNSFIGVYTTSDSLSIISNLRDAAYGRYLSSEFGHTSLGADGVQSNLAFKDAFNLINGVDQLHDSPCQTIILGDDYLNLSMSAIGTLISICEDAGKKYVLGRNLHREYFMKKICKY